MRYVVAGVGRCGLSAAIDLVAHCEASEVLALDARFQDGPALEQTRQQLSRQLGAQASVVELRGVDLSYRSMLDHLADRVRDYDCMVSALPYALNGLMSQVAVDAGVPMCDMGGNPDMVDVQKRLAVEHNHVIVPECGLAPGIANVLIKHLHERHGATTIEAFCGGLPREAPDPAVNPLQYKLVFSPQGLISEYMGACPILEDGRVRRVPALSGLERFDDDHEAFYTSNNSPSILEYFASLGIEHCRYKTLRYHGHLGKIRLLQSLGFLQRDDSTDPELAERLAGSPPLAFDRAADEDKVLVTVRGSAAGRLVGEIELVDYLDRASGLTAMERTTAWGTTIVAYALASGKSRPSNFATPEQFIDTDWFIEQLNRRTGNLSIR